MTGRNMNLRVDSERRKYESEHGRYGLRERNETR